MRLRLLVLGGTFEAGELARRLSRRPEFEATLSLAGRTSAPKPSALPMRIGGFGGAEGLARYLTANGVEAVIDATHPFAARMSANAVAACAAVGLPLALLTRPPWRPVAGDRWREVLDAAEAVEALGAAPRRVLLTVGRLQAPAFRAAPQHHYVLRSIDAPENLPPSVEIVLARPPFSLAGERELMRSRRIDVLVSKNSGGDATRAKIDAARELALEVVMFRRPPMGGAVVFYDVDAALSWIEAHSGGAA